MVDEGKKDPNGIKLEHSGYLPISKVNSGGMADIYLGVQYRRHSFERFVAIKQIRDGGPVEHQKTGVILDEAKLVARLSHPNIVQMLDLVENNGKKAIIMEYVQGENLRYIIKAMNQRKKRIPLALACSLVIQACEALEYAHDLQLATGRHLRIVHRDIDPVNLMLASSGHVKIVDFGIAANAEQQALTAPGFRKGKLAYMAPENFEKGQVDRRGDIYSLGLVFFEMLTGQKARKITAETNPTVAFRAITENVSLTQFLKGKFPKGLANIVHRATRRDPKKRFQSAGEFGAAVRSYARQHADVLTPTEIKVWFDAEFPEVATRCKNREGLVLNRLQEYAAYLSDPKSLAQPSQDSLRSAVLEQNQDLQVRPENGELETETSVLTKTEISRMADDLFGACAADDGAKPLEIGPSAVLHPTTAPPDALRTPSPTMMQIVGVRSTLRKAIYTVAVSIMVLFAALIASWFFPVEEKISRIMKVGYADKTDKQQAEVDGRPEVAEAQQAGSPRILLALGSVPQYDLHVPCSGAACLDYDSRGVGSQLPAGKTEEMATAPSDPGSERALNMDFTDQLAKRDGKARKRKNRGRSEKSRNAKRKANRKHKK